MADRHITAAMCAYGRTLAEPRLSPDGTRVAFLANVQGRAQLVVVDLEQPGPELTVTAEPAPRPAASYGGGAVDWTPDGEALVYAAKIGGLWLISASGGPARRLVEHERAVAPAVAPTGDRVAYLVDNQQVAVAWLEEGGPWPIRLSAGADFCFDPCWSPDGSLVAWHEWDVPAMPWDASRVVLRDANAADKPVVVAGGDGVSTQQPRFAPDGRLGFLSDETGWLNLWVADPDGSGARPLLEEEAEHGEPSWGPGQRSFAWSSDGRQVAFSHNQRGRSNLTVLDGDGSATDTAPGSHGGLSWVGARLAAVRSDARTPTEIVVYERGAARPVARGPVAGFEAADFGEPEPVQWTAEDGEVVHGRLYLPARPALDPPPLIVWIHGGPTGQFSGAFNARVAYFMDRGWAILAPDHRGSTGYGREYTQALAGRWGELDVADTAAGMRAAAEQGWGDPRRMVPMGGSAGGFTVLLLLALHGDLCAAGVDLYGVADLLELNETTHRFEAHYLHSIVGPLPEAADRYRRRSPINLVERIEAPLLILQGDADEVVPPAQSRTIADQLRALGRTVELHEYEGEGHGWLRPETMVDELERVESFLRRHVLEWKA